MFQQVSKIVSLCKKYDCILVSDEIHCDLVLEGSKLESCGKYLDEYDKIIILTAPSKTFNIAGLLITNCIIKNKEYIEAFRRNLRGQLDNIDIKEADGSITNLGEKYGNKIKKGN